MDLHFVHIEPTLAAYAHPAVPLGRIRIELAVSLSADGGAGVSLPQLTCYTCDAGIELVPTSQPEPSPVVI